MPTLSTVRSPSGHAGRWIAAAAVVLGAIGGAALTVNAALPFVAVLAVAAAGATLRRPELGIVAVLAASGFGLVMILVGIGSALVSTGSFALALVGAVGTLLSPARSRTSLRLTMATIAVLAVGLISSRGAIPIEQAIQGARIFSTPLLCAIIASSLGAPEARRLMRLGTVIVGLSLLAALLEYALGVDRLLGLGLEYGTTVRSYNNLLRAPGLFTTNYSLGSFAGVMGALAITWWPTFESSKSMSRWRIVAITASLGCLVLSIYRTGFFVLFIAVGVWILADQTKGSFARRFLAGALGVGMFTYVVVSGLASSASLEDRKAVWHRVLADHPLEMFGHGLGFSGSASGSRYAAEQIVVDNYFLNLTLQLGVVAVLVFITIAAIGIQTLRRSAARRPFQSGATLLAVLAGFMLVDFWEYTSAMALILSAVALSPHLTRDPMEPTLADIVT